MLKRPARILIFINFRKLDVTIYPTVITVSFGIITKKISLEEVLSCEPVKARLDVYTGAGVRIEGDGALAFITRIGGDAVSSTYFHPDPSSSPQTDRTKSSTKYKVS